MSDKKILSPNKLWENLLNINPQHFNGIYPDIEMLRDNYQRYSEREESKVAKSSFQKAIDDWVDEQKSEFIYLLTENQVSSLMSSKELHKTLMKVYKLIFEI